MTMNSTGAKSRRSPAGPDARLLGVADTAELLYGSATTANKARVIRLVKSGSLRAVRTGQRGDRWITRETIEGFLASGAPS